MGIEPPFSDVRGPTLLELLGIRTPAGVGSSGGWESDASAFSLYPLRLGLKLLRDAKAEREAGEQRARPLILEH